LFISRRQSTSIELKGPGVKRGKEELVEDRRREEEIAIEKE